MQQDLSGALSGTPLVGGLMQSRRPESCPARVAMTPTALIPYGSSASKR